MKKKIVLILLVILVFLVTSFIAFTYIINKKSQEKQQELTTLNVTKGLSVKYKASSNIINVDDTLEFTVEGKVSKGQAIDWEIALEGNGVAKKVNISLTKLDKDGVFTEVNKLSSYQMDNYKSIYTGKPSDMMSLFEEETTQSFTTKYRLKIKSNKVHTADEKSAKFKVNIYGMVVDNKGDIATSFLVNKANSEDFDYNSATDEQKNQMWTFSHGATEQLGATTDYRYIGKDPNNYVVFNNELWRIIGVFDTDDGTGKITKRLKIINFSTKGFDKNKASPLRFNNFGLSFSDYGKNNWSDSHLNYLLNDGHTDEAIGGSLYWNSESGKCYCGNTKTTACDFTKIGLNNIAKTKIDNVKWYLGGSSTYNDVSAEMFYQRERGTTVYNSATRDTSWVGKVALVYPSDYGYATSGSDKTSRKDCLVNALYNWSKANLRDCDDNDWISNFGSTITPSAKTWHEMFQISYGSVGISSTLDKFSRIYRFPSDVTPNVYLKPDVKIISGVGAIDNPYILK